MDYLGYLKDRRRDLIAMIHLPALPGTPRSSMTPAEVVERAVAEAKLLRDAGVTTVMIENMHDVPYTRSVGPEIGTTMAVAGARIKAETGLWCGVQVLAGCNREALAVAHAAGLDFVRVEGFVFGHVGDEGWIESSAGDILRYRRSIGAERVAVFADIKKKHSAHAVTADVPLRDTAEAASFFLADGVIVTGTCTGRPADPEDLRALRGLGVPVLVGSGVTPENMAEFLPLADALIVGSWFKVDGRWENGPDPSRVRRLVETFAALQATHQG